MSNTNAFFANEWIERKWWCADCRVPINLDRHGRCGTCGSDAVDMMLRPNRMGKPLPLGTAGLEDVSFYIG